MSEDDKKQKKGKCCVFFPNYLPCHNYTISLVYLKLYPPCHNITRIYVILSLLILVSFYWSQIEPLWLLYWNHLILLSLLPFIQQLFSLKLFLVWQTFVCLHISSIFQTDLLYLVSSPKVMKDINSSQVIAQKQHKVLFPYWSRTITLEWYKGIVNIELDMHFVISNNTL